MAAQQQQAHEQQGLFQLMADQQKAMLGQMASAQAQAQANQQVWEQVVKLMAKTWGRA